MNVVIYARYSSGSGQTDQSVEGQLMVCREYALRNNMNVVGEYVDRSISGKSVEKRDDFQRMISDSNYKEFEGVIVYQFDRFSRNREDSVVYKGILKKNGVRVISARENITDDASGIILEGLLEAMAEYYSAELSQKIVRGMQKSADKLQVYGSLPYGYKNVEKKYVINEDRAKWVRKIYQMYLDGVKITEICEYLNGMGINNALGKPFRISYISKMLQNKRYCGYYTYKGSEIDGAIPVIISKEDFNAVQKKLEKNKRAPGAGKAVDEKYLLTTKIFCGVCGGAIIGTGGTGRNGTMHHYYGCTNRLKRKTNKCSKKTIKKDYLEELVVNECLKLLSDDNIMKIADEVMRICNSGKSSSNLSKLKKSLKNLSTQKSNLINSLKFANGNEGFQKDVMTQYADIEKQESEIQKEIFKEQNMQNTLTQEQILVFLNRFKNGDITDYKYKQLLVDVFINQIYLYDDEIKIAFNTQSECVDVHIPLLEECAVGSYVQEVSPPKEVPPIDKKVFINWWFFYALKLLGSKDAGYIDIRYMM